MKKRCTIIITSENENTSKKIKIPYFGVVLIAFLIVGLFVLFTIESLALLNLRDDIATITILKMKEHDHRHQLLVLKKKVKDLDEELALLRDFNSRLSDIVSGGTKNPDAGEEKGRANDLKRSAIVTENLLVRNLHSCIQDISEGIYVEKEVSKDLLTQLERKRSIIAHTPSIWPVRGWLSCPFGIRKSPFTRKKSFHRGVDIATKKGKPIYAPADGIVTSYKYKGRIGNLLVINHGYGIVTRYGHLAENQVGIGQYVHRGDVIAFVGNTGRSTGPHLHYEVLVNSVQVNPKRYMLK